MKNILKIGALVLLLVGCNKDKFQTKPQLKLISGGNYLVDLQEAVPITLEFTDKEGDVSDSIFIRKVWRNQVQGDTVPSMRLKFAIPDFPSTSQGRFQITLNNTNLQAALQPRSQTGAPNGKEPDTLDLRIHVRDNANNISDTLTVPNIVVIRS